MRCLRDINVDSNTVGWYQSAPYKDFQTLNLLDTFISYEESVKKCVCIVCDPKDCVRGSLALKALRLSKKFMEMYKVNTSVRLPCFQVQHRSRLSCTRFQLIALSCSLPPSNFTTLASHGKISSRRYPSRSRTHLS